MSPRFEPPTAAALTHPFPQFGQVVAKTGTSEAEKKEGEQKKETKKTQ